MDLNNGKIRLYNYERSPVGFPSQYSQQGVFLRGRDEDEEFVVERVALDDIEAENSKSDLFKVGRLRFHPDEEAEAYLRLGIDDLENIMTDKTLVDFLLTDNVDNVKRISNLKSMTLISRMKSMLFSMERGGKVPPPRITAAVIERSSELTSGGKRNPNSEINKILEAEKKANEDNQLKDTLEVLRNEVATLRKEKEDESKVKDDLITKQQLAMEELLKKVEELTKVQPEKQEPKQAGRPPKNNG